MPPRSLALFTFALVTSLLGCGESDGDGDGAGNGTNGGSSADNGGEANGGDTSSGGSTSTGGTANGGTANGGTGGGVTGARSCEQDCEALADTLCAEDDFSVATCVPECEQAFQYAAASAEEKGCLEEFLVLDVCRADDPVCTHPSPTECVEENASYIQCLEDAI